MTRENLNKQENFQEKRGVKREGRKTQAKNTAKPKNENKVIAEKPTRARHKKPQQTNSLQKANFMKLVKI